MRRWKSLFVVVMAVVLLLAFSACGVDSRAIGNAMHSTSASSSASTVDVFADVKLTQVTEFLEYSNKDVDPLTLVTCDDEDVEVTIQDKIDLGKVGKQSVSFDLAKGDSKTTRTVSFTILDTHSPEISLKDGAPSITQGDSFDVISNVDSVVDPVDGALKQVESEPAQMTSKNTGGGSSGASPSGQTSGSASSSKQASSSVASGSSSAASSASASASSASSSSAANSSASKSSSASNSAVAGTQRFYEDGWFMVSGTLDTATPGAYPITVAASDMHGNRVKKEFIVTVNPTPAEEPAMDAVPAAAAPAPAPATNHYVLNTNTKKFHWPHCSSVGKMKDKNRQDVDATREEVINWGYVPCKICNP